MMNTEILVRLKTALFSLSEAETVALQQDSKYIERIRELRELAELLYEEVNQFE